jgi:hypothetical protein
MSFIVFVQIFANVVFTAALFVAFARLRRPAKDDPRLSKGLQLLSSKIAVLEDLSDRTETQVQQMLLLLDQKSRELQSKIGLAEQQVSLVRQSMQQSLEVAQIFQDKIPHSEIIERQNSVKYIRAARMAHAGVSADEIAKEVDLPFGEIEFISKVNHENLSFREEELPSWAREPEKPEVSVTANVAHQNMAASMVPVVIEQMPVFVESAPQDNLVEQLNKLQFEMKNLDLELAYRSARNVMPDTTQAFSQPRVESSSLERLGQEFRRAVEQAEQSEQAGHAGSFAKTFADAFTGGFESEQAMPEPAKVEAAPLGVPPRAQTNVRPVLNPELEAARAAAAALRTQDDSTQPRTTSNNVIKSVRRVEFPRI